MKETVEYPFKTKAKSYRPCVKYVSDDIDVKCCMCVRWAHTLL